MSHNNEVLEKLIRLEKVYESKFGEMILHPANISEERVYEVYLAAFEKGEPVSPDFDWWANLPDGARS